MKILEESIEDILIFMMIFKLVISSRLLSVFSLDYILKHVKLFYNNCFLIDLVLQLQDYSLIYSLIL